ncbi:MAG: hypothetical protein PHS96_13520, partial [Anaerolineales bacterium]|nr:hypothetical protein [Anaerolineales bacterium]
MHTPQADKKIFKVLPRDLFKKKRTWLVLGGVLVLVAAGVFFVVRNNAATEDASASEAAMQTAVARRGDLVVSASGSWQVIAASVIELSFDEIGTLIELNVSVGQQVKAGEVLARMQ